MASPGGPALNESGRRICPAWTPFCLSSPSWLHAFSSDPDATDRNSLSESSFRNDGAALVETGVVGYGGEEPAPRPESAGGGTGFLVTMLSQSEGLSVDGLGAEAWVHGEPVASLSQPRTTCLPALVRREPVDCSGSQELKVYVPRYEVISRRSRYLEIRDSRSDNASSYSSVVIVRRSIAVVIEETGICAYVNLTGSN